MDVTFVASLLAVLWISASEQRAPTLPTAVKGSNPAPSANLALLALQAELLPLPPELIDGYMQALDKEASDLLAGVGEPSTPNERLVALNDHFFGSEGFVPIEDTFGRGGISLVSVLNDRRGTCVGLAIAYLALAERIGLEAHAVATPDHMFVRVGLGNRSRNVELLEGGIEIDDDMYRRRHKIDSASIDNGVFLRNLTEKEVLAHVFVNQGIALSRQGELGRALQRYEQALELTPALVAAWYNRGVDLLHAGRLQDALASFNRSIELYAGDAQAFNNRGLTNWRLADLRAAEADFRQALQLEPALLEAEHNLQLLLSQTTSAP